jgi:hypothetical protein
MYLKLNDHAFELEIADTAFAHYWHDEWLFKDQEMLHLWFDHTGAHSRKLEHIQHVQRLKRIIDENNEIVTRLGISDDYLYEPINPNPSMSLLSDTHEKWADITKKKFEWDLQEEDVMKIYDAINSELSEDYSLINNYVHAIEFLYKFFYIHDVDIPLEEIGRSYTIVPSDTSFKKELGTIPYYDIGRPQFEKYQIDRTIDHPEISNYMHISNRIHFTSGAMVEDVPKSYYALGAELNVPIYGNYLPVLKSADISPYAFGEFIMTYLQADDNQLSFSKGD